MSSQPTDLFFIMARVHWPQLFAMGTYTDPDTNNTTITPPSVQIMLHKEADAEEIKKLKARVNAVCRFKNHVKEQDGEHQGKGRLVEPSKRLLQDGDFLTAAEYTGHWKFTAKTQQPRDGGEVFPYVADPYDPDVRITDSAGAHKIYGGCYCTIGVELYFSKNYGRVGASLHSIQFEKDGDRLIGGQVSDEVATAGFSKKSKPSIADNEDWDEGDTAPTAAASEDDDEF